MGAILKPGTERNGLVVLNVSREKVGEHCWSNIQTCKCLLCNQIVKQTSKILRPSRKGKGCKDCARQNMINNLQKMHERIKMEGQIFGDYLILTQSERNEKYKPYYYKCKCLKCGEEIEKNGNNLRRGKGLYCNKERVSQGEIEIEQILKENNIPFQKEYSFKKEKEQNEHMKFDFYVNNHQVIEFDGEQHFVPVSTFGGEERFKRTQEVDKIKNNFCLQRDIPIIRIPYWERGKIKLNDLLPQYSQFLIKEEKENVILE